MRSGRLKIYFDGGCRPNPGTMEIAVVARGITHHRPALGFGTNTDAEWLALIEAVRLARTLDAPAFDLLGDSAVVVNQASGQWPCRSPELARHLATFQALVAGRPPIRIKRIRRAQNLAGIALVRIAAGLATPHPGPAD